MSALPAAKLPSNKLPWNDRAGRLSALKLASLAALVAPAFWIAWQAAFGLLGSKPLTEANHQAGDWAVRFLLVSLAVTPLRAIADWSKLILIRRQIGLAALFYTLLHVALYVALEAFDLAKVAAEIALRPYLTIGFVALLGLAALGVTSTDAMIKRLGSVRWNRLHAIVYGLAVLALVHFALQKKIDVTEPALMAGFFVWLMGFRLLRRRGFALGPLDLAGLAIGAALATVAIEAGWYALFTGVPWRLVLAANLDFEFSIRPAWWVLAAGLAMAALAAVRTSLGGRPKRLREPRLAPAPARTPYPER
jgi:methionine sulfoxide reductase heme-binding subunit